MERFEADINDLLNTVHDFYYDKVVEKHLKKVLRKEHGYSKKQLKKVCWDGSFILEYSQRLEDEGVVTVHVYIDSGKIRYANIITFTLGQVEELDKDGDLSNLI